jgi:hypothetical protein
MSILVDVAIWTEAGVVRHSYDREPPKDIPEKFNFVEWVLLFQKTSHLFDFPIILL